MAMMIMATPTGIMIVGVNRAWCVAVRVGVIVYVHRSYYCTGLSTHSQPRRGDLKRVDIGKYDTTASEFVDATHIHCHHQKWPIKKGKSRHPLVARGQTGGDEQPNRQIEFLGCARFHAHRRSRHLALRRKYALR
jgi:hypothetical protein